MKNEITKELNIETLKSYEESFIDYLDIDELSMKSYKCGIERFIEYLKENNIKNATRENVREYRDYLRDNYSSNTVNTYMVAIKSLFKYLSIHKIYEDITIDIKGAKYTDIPVKQVLSMEQIKTIYNGLTDLEEKALFSLLITTGVRGCEVATANIEDIKIHNGEVVLYILGKKRDSKCEYVKLSDNVLNDIKNYIGDRTTGSIFISTSNNSKGKGITTTSIRTKIKNIFKRFGLDDNTFSLHSTRRTCATIMYQNGVDAYSIQQILHHKSSQTTTRYINAITRNENNGEKIISNLIFN